MNIKKINIKAFSIGLTFTLICSGCTFNKDEEKEGISYFDLVNNYRMIEFSFEDKNMIHFLKKECIEGSCYGYYDVVNNDCVVKVDEEVGSIITSSKIVINSLTEHNMKEYLDYYNVTLDTFSDEELNILIGMIKDDYYANEDKKLVKERD